jgi:hypothetical protein
MSIFSLLYSSFLEWDLMRNWLFSHLHALPTPFFQSIHSLSLVSIGLTASGSHIHSGPSLTLAGSSLLKSCSSKCIDTSYREADLNKGESVCLDRCVAKFFEVNVKVSEKMQGEAQGRGGGGGGMFGGA